MRVGTHPSDAAALRVEIASGGDAADGWVTPRELAKGLAPAPEEGPLSGLTSVRKSIEKLTEPSPLLVEHYSRQIANFALRGDPYADEPVELVPGTDLVLEEEVVMPRKPGPMMLPDGRKRCASPTCERTFVPHRARKYCDACAFPNDAEPVAKPAIAVVKPPEREQGQIQAPRVTPRPAPSPTVAPRNAPYDAVIADLLVKREQLDRAIDALREIAGAA